MFRHDRVCNKRLRLTQMQLFLETLLLGPTRTRGARPSSMNFI
jgi:hypothetical protein